MTLPARKLIAANQINDPTQPATGRRLTRWSGTAAEARQQAVGIITSNSLSEIMRWIITDLWRFVSLTEDQLWIQRNTLFDNTTNKGAFQKILSKYRQMGLIDILPPVNSYLTEVGIRPTVTSLRPYALGPVGAEAMMHIVGGDKSTEHPYRGEGERRLAHDLICSEILLRWAHLTQNFDGTLLQFTTHGPRELLVRSEDNKQTEVAPDGMMISWRDGVISRHFLMEYHNETYGGRAAKKIDIYEKVAENNVRNRLIWRSIWEGNDMPRLLVIYRTAHILEDYREQITQRISQGEAPRCWYVAMSLEDALGGQLQKMEIIYKPR